jgi:hypothetical protein
MNIYGRQFGGLFAAAHSNAVHRTWSNDFNSPPVSITAHVIRGSNNSVPENLVARSNVLGSMSNYVRSAYPMSTLESVPAFAMSNVCMPLFDVLLSNAVNSPAVIGRPPSTDTAFLAGGYKAAAFQAADRASSNFNFAQMSNALFRLDARQPTRYEYYKSNGYPRSNMFKPGMLAFHALSPCFKLMQWGANLPSSENSVAPWDQRLANFSNYVEEARSLLTMLNGHVPGYQNTLNDLQAAVNNSREAVSRALGSYGISSNMAMTKLHALSASALTSSNALLSSRRDKLVVVTDYLIEQNQAVARARLVMYAWILCYVVVTVTCVYFIIAERRDVLVVLSTVVMLSFAIALIWKTIAYLREENKR